MDTIINIKKIYHHLLWYWPAYTATILWLAFSDTKDKFTNFSTTCLTLGLLTAIAGASLYAWTVILSSRLRIIEELFIGINKAYTAHHKIGTITFILIVLHPLFLTLQYLPYGTSAIREFIQPKIEAYPMWFGIIALDITIAALIVTYFVKIKYHLWKRIHQLLGIALFFATAHIVTTPSVSDTNTPLKILLYTLYTSAIILFLTRTAMGKWFIKRYRYIVIDIKNKSETIKEIFPKPAHEQLSYKPGQFIFIKLNNPKIKKEFHPFSLTSNPKDTILSIAVKQIGDFTTQLNQLQIGDTADIEGPYGKFQFDTKNNKQIWIAGGIGITPFLSGLRTLDKNHTKIIYLFYATKTQEEAVYLNELNKHAQRLPNIHIVPIFQNKNGYLTIQTIQSHIKNIQEYDLFLCGPPAMMKSLKTQAIKIGVKEEKLHTEEFTLYEGK